MITYCHKLFKMFSNFCRISQKACGVIRRPWGLFHCQAKLGNGRVGGCLNFGNELFC